MAAIYSMNPETRSAYLASLAKPGQRYDIVYGRYAGRRTVRGEIVGVAASLTSAIADQLVVRAAYGGAARPLYVLSSAEIYSVTEVDH